MIQNIFFKFIGMSLFVRKIPSNKSQSRNDPCNESCSQSFSYTSWEFRSWASIRKFVSVAHGLIVFYKKFKACFMLSVKTFPVFCFIFTNLDHISFGFAGGTAVWDEGKRINCEFNCCFSCVFIAEFHDSSRG